MQLAKTIINCFVSCEFCGLPHAVLVQHTNMLYAEFTQFTDHITFNLTICTGLKLRIR